MNKSFGFIDITLQNLQEKLYGFCDLPGEKQVVKRLPMLMVIYRSFKPVPFYRSRFESLPFRPVVSFRKSADTGKVCCLT